MFKILSVLLIISLILSAVLYHNTFRKNYINTSANTFCNNANCQSIIEDCESIDGNPIIEHGNATCLVEEKKDDVSIRAEAKLYACTNTGDNFDCGPAVGYCLNAGGVPLVNKYKVECIMKDLK